MIEIKHLKKEYELATPLKDVNAIINKGDVISVIGPSGTGKSTLLRCINMLEKPTLGEILVDGVNIAGEGINLPNYRRKIGMVFQNFNLFENMTVIENISFAPINLLKAKKDDAFAEAMELLKMVDLEDRALAYPDILSGGQKQRVAIARTLAMHPEIVLFDEPTSALDPCMVTEVQNVIENLAKKGTTMMVVTHEMSFARRISNRVFYMDEGGIYEEGTPTQIFDNPQKEKTIAFIRMQNTLDVEYDLSLFDNLNLEQEYGKVYAYALERGMGKKKLMHLSLCIEEAMISISHLPEKNKNVRFRICYNSVKDDLSMDIDYKFNPLDYEDNRDDLSLMICSKYLKNPVFEKSIDNKYVSTFHSTIV